MAPGSFSTFRLMFPLMASRHKCCRERGLPGSTCKDTSPRACNALGQLFHSSVKPCFTQYVRNLLPLGPGLQDPSQFGTDADVAHVVQERPHHAADQMRQP